MRTLYFAHPVNVYNTPLEQKLLREISIIFSAWDIENPNQPHHQEGYKTWKKEKGNGMLYYFEDVLPKMDGGIGLTFLDGKFGKGVAGELEFLFKAGKPIWEINNSGIISIIYSLGTERILDVEQTKQRIYIDGEFSKGIKPYL